MALFQIDINERSFAAVDEKHCGQSQKFIPIKNRKKMRLRAANYPELEAPYGPWVCYKCGTPTDLYRLEMGAL
jgi:hypothetical protein